MMLLEALLLALREIRRNVLRSTLTTLGIVIGVAAVIVMVTLGAGATASVTDSIASLGTDVLTVMPGQQRGRGGASATARPFTIGLAEALERDISSVVAVAPVASTPMNAILGPRNWSTTVTGTTNAYLDIQARALQSGRRFTDAELRGGTAVCLVGKTVRRELFGAQDPVGERLRLGSLSCTIVGVLAPKGQTVGQDQDDTVIVPLRTFQRRIAGNEDVRQIQVQVREGSSARSKLDIQRLLRERRRLAPGATDDFTILDPQEIAATVTSATMVLTTLLAAVASVSLLVGGIGIMNIMLVSVTERTREIGIRLAIGALGREVLAQFLVEAVVLSGLGGLIGVLLAIAGSYFATRALSIPFLLDPATIVIALLFSGAVGVIFGFFPARRAARLNPIDALRHE